MINLNFKFLKFWTKNILDNEKNIFRSWKSALANNFSKKYFPPVFRLKIKFDKKSKLVMINKHIRKERMFNFYPYRSSKSKLVEKLFKELSQKIKKKLKPKNILEIGCNDGTFASNFNKKNITCISLR